MTINEAKDLVESRDMIYKGEFLKQLSIDEFNNGIRKVNLQEINDLDNLNGEGVWVWLSEEDRKEYSNDSSNKIIKGILANNPFNYENILFWGSEIEIKCNCDKRPNLSKEWTIKKILNTDWYKKERLY